MLDNAIRSQLQSVFAELPVTVTLHVGPSDHAKHGELVTMARDVADTSDQITFSEGGPANDLPTLSVMVDGAPTGVQFKGVPGGHEFTSLIMAVLHAAGQGRRPDAGIVNRIAALKGPVSLRTVVSLDCTNCPDVIQALNLMAVIHGDFRHEMVDGGLVAEEIDRLGIQGVPTVLHGDNIIHVGKADLGGLLDLLEDRFGSQESAEGGAEHQVDVAVVGGGPAGAAAAIYSARKGLKTALIAGKIGGQVNDTLGIENLINKAYIEGPTLANDLRKNLDDAGVQIMENRQVQDVQGDEIHTLTLKGGETVVTSQVIIATGAKWRELGVPGEKEHIGRGVAFCPHCDGPFYKDKRVAVVGGGNSGIEAAIDLAGICSDVTVLEFGDELRADAVLQRKAKALDNVQIITSARTTEVVAADGSVNGLAYEDRTTGDLKNINLDGVFVQIGLAPNSAFIRDVVEVNKQGEIVVDDHGRTSKAGIYAAGDVTNVPYKQIIIAMGDGAKVALAAFEDRMRNEAPTVAA